MKDRLFILFQYCVPQRLLTALAGRVAESEVTWLKGAFIRAFIKRFNVDMTEAERPDPDQYRNFNEFFTRALKPGARPIAAGEGVVACPADGAISQIGPIREGSIFQAKGKSFDCTTLLGCAQQASRYQAGLFTTVYLSPRDYHRLHMPVDGKLLSTRYIPGKLFSVNDVTAQHVDGLFAKNERLVMEFDTAFGPMAAVMVGAMIVGSMETVWQRDVAGNRRVVVETDWSDQGIELCKGDELGRFKLGSTIILCFPAGALTWEPTLKAGDPVRMGQAIGNAVSTAQ